MNLFNYNFLPNKKHFANILNKKIKEHNLSISDLAKKFLYDEKTIYSWVNGKSLPSDIETLKEISKMFNLSISSLLFENEKYEEYLDNETINSYNYFWFLIEKYSFSFLGIFEKKELINYSFDNKIYFDNELIQNSNLFDYINRISNSSKINYKREVSDEVKNELMFKLHSKIKFEDYNKILNEIIHSKNLSNLINKISNFDKLILHTLIRYEVLESSKLEEYFTQNNSEYLKIDDLISEINLENILNYLSNINYDLFKNLLKKSEDY